MFKVSRGCLGQGVIAGESLVAHIPVLILAVERSPLNLVPCIQSWSGRDSILKEVGWFQAGHNIEGWSMDKDGFERPVLLASRRSCIWDPSPLAVEMAIAELRNARIKRQSSCYIFLPQALYYAVGQAVVLFR